jgi:hypothetical protein
MRRVPVLAVLAALTLSRPAQADQPLNLSEIAPVALDGFATITISGVLRSSHDGSLIDATTTRAGDDGTAQPGGFLDVEAGGLRVVWRDLDRHVFRMVATGSPGPLCGAAKVSSPCLVPRLGALAQERLLGVREFAQTLSGAPVRSLSVTPLRWRQWVPLTPLAVLPVWLIWRRIRRPPTAWQECKQLLDRLQRRLRQGDPVHQRLLAPVEALTDHAHRLEHERRRGVAEGWPGETARASQGLATILFRLRAIDQTLDQSAREGRGELDTRLIKSLGQDLEVALSARREAERIS